MMVLARSLSMLLCSLRRKMNSLMSCSNLFSTSVDLDSQFYTCQLNKICSLSLLMVSWFSIYSHKISRCSI